MSHCNINFVASYCDIPRRPQHGVRHDEGDVHQHATHDHDWGLDQLDLLWIHHKWVAYCLVTCSHFDVLIFVGLLLPQHWRLVPHFGGLNGVTHSFLPLSHLPSSPYSLSHSLFSIPCISPSTHLSPSLLTTLHSCLPSCLLIYTPLPFPLHAAKVPFPLTLRFKGMLQRGIELKTLSASWYDLTNVWLIHEKPIVHCTCMY